MPVAAFEFVAVQEPRLTARLVRQSAGLDATVVLDLEDALWDITDEQHTHALKDGGRRDLVTLATANPELFAGQRIGVRLNRLRGEHAKADQATLVEVSRRISLACVVATKVESGAELYEWGAALAEAHLAPRGLVPIVETIAGMANLADILAAARGLGVEWVVYGYYDHALDVGWWPFAELDSDAFWDLVSPIIDQIEAAGLNYVQAPFFQLHQPDRFAAVLGRLSRTCRRAAGAITLGRAQTALAAAFDGRLMPDHGPAVSRPSPLGDPRALARHVVDTYLANRRLGASFAVDGRSGEFISPHLYLAAQRHLKRDSA